MSGRRGGSPAPPAAPLIAVSRTAIRSSRCRARASGRCTPSASIGLGSHDGIAHLWRAGSWTGAADVSDGAARWRRSDHGDGARELILVHPTGRVAPADAGAVPGSAARAGPRTAHTSPSSPTAREVRDLDRARRRFRSCAHRTRSRVQSRRSVPGRHPARFRRDRGAFIVRVRDGQAVGSRSSGSHDPAANRSSQARGRPTGVGSPEAARTSSTRWRKALAAPTQDGERPVWLPDGRRPVHRGGVAPPARRSHRGRTRPAVGPSGVGPGAALTPTGGRSHYR